jgi:hypothetical protein
MFLEIRTARMWRIMQACWIDTLRMRVLPTQAGAGSVRTGTMERACSAYKRIDKARLQRRPVDE